MRVSKFHKRSESIQQKLSGLFILNKTRHIEWKIHKYYLTVKICKRWLDEGAKRNITFSNFLSVSFSIEKK